MKVNESNAIQDLPQQPGRGVGWLTNICCAAVMLASWWAFSAPRGLEIIFILLGFLLAWAVIGFYWLRRLISYLKASAECRANSPLTARVSWCVPPLLCAVTMASLYYRLPLRIRFEASRVAMNSVLNDERNGVPFKGPRWVGWYHITGVGNTEAVNKSIWVSMESDLGFQHYSGTDENPYRGISLGDGWYTYAHFPT